MMVNTAGNQLNLGAMHPAQGPQARPGTGMDLSEEIKTVDNPTFNSRSSMTHGESERQRLGWEHHRICPIIWACYILR